MRSLWIVLALLLVACGDSAATSTHTAAPTPNLALTATAIVRRGGFTGATPGVPTATNRPPPPLPNKSLPSPSPVAVSIVSVTGAPPGRAASATIHGPPNTTCSIEFFAPGGETSDSPGLENKRTDANGGVSWSWTITATTPLGIGRIIVFCGSQVGTGPITIG